MKLSLILLYSRWYFFVSKQTRFETVTIEYCTPSLDQWAKKAITLYSKSLDNNIKQIVKGMHNGSIKVPDYLKEVNPPTLMTYYETLPS